MTHTKGPWKASFKARSNENEAHWEIRHTAGHDWHVADVYGVTQGEKTYGHGHAEVNARLIAAAPELLAALKGLINSSQASFHVSCNGPGCTCGGASAYVAATRAIAKAEGEETP